MTSNISSYSICDDCGKVYQHSKLGKIPVGVVRFRFSDAGIAGDADKLLVATIEGSIFDGNSESILFNRSAPFYSWRLRRARRKMLKKMNALVCCTK